MLMKCCVRKAVLVTLYIAQLLPNNNPLLADGKELSDKKSLRNAVQLGTDLNYNEDKYLLYRNHTSEVMLYDNRKSKSIKTRRQKKKRNRTKKGKCKRDCIADSLNTKLKPAVNSDAGLFTKEKNLVERASLETGKKIGNVMTGSSQIGDKKYHTVIKPTVVVNYHGAIKYGGNKMKFGKRSNAKRKLESGGENLIHINQEVNLGPPHGVIKVDKLGIKNKTKEDIKRYFPKGNFHFSYE